jgi:virginiamycin B lyase
VDPRDQVTEEARQALPRIGRSSRGGWSSPPLYTRPRLRRALVGSLLGVVAALLLPGAALAIDEFPIPTPTSLPTGITAGPDGAIWFVEENGNRVGRITTSGQITEFLIPTASATPQEIVAGPDGALWFTEYGNNKIGRITSAGVFDPPNGYDLPAGAGPDGITAGPDGALWFTQIGTDQIGKITTSGSISHYPLVTGFNPGDIAAGPDGRLWFTESEAGKVGAINPSTGAVQEFDRPGADPSAITSSGASLWFTQFSANRIEQMSTSGAQINVFPAGSGPSGIAFGPDGAIWFAQSVANKIGRLTTSGSLTEFPVPTTATEGPDGVAAGPDHAIWFTEKGANQIGRIEAPAAGGGGGGGPPPTTQQVTASVQSLGVSPRSFRSARRGASIAAKVGATVTYRLSVAATTSFTVERQTAGRKKGKKCVPQTRRNRRAKRCKRYVAVRGSFTHAGKAGSNSFKFTGRVAKKKLRPGRYQLVASVPASSASPKRAAFKIVRR